MVTGNSFVMKDNNSKCDSATSHPMPKIDFSTFILSLYSSGLVHLGKVEDPSTGIKTKNLVMAKHSIDVIAMLEEKTRGNLNNDEANLLKSLLSELRLAFVEAKK